MKTVAAAALLLILSTPGAAGELFSTARASETVRHLAVDIGPRPMGSPAEAAALRFAADQFRANGCDTSYIMPFDFTHKVNTSSGIAVGIKRGTSGRMIVIGGHIDSSSPEAPGADDDASGSAVVIECSRVLASSVHASTIVFCCFGGEEQDLCGSEYFAGHFISIDSVTLMLQTDMANGLGVLDIDPDGRGGMSAPSWLVRATVEEYRILGYTALRYPTHFFSLNYATGSGAGSDHESFLARGVPAIDFSTDIASPIHTPCDNIGNFDPRGLGRTGELVLRLFNRFDGGVPSRSPERYWLWLAGPLVIVLPAGALTALPVLAFLTAIAAFIRLRRQEPPGTPRVRWSCFKIWLSSLILLSAAVCSGDVVSLVRSVRFPWVTNAGVYVLLGISSAAVLLPVWIVLLRRLRISRRPSGYFLISAISLIILTFLLSLLNTKLGIEPAAALLLLSLAVLVPWPGVKISLALLAPVWPFRLVFSEWLVLLLRSFAASPVSNWPVRNTTFVILLSLLSLPFLTGTVALARQSDQVARALRRMAGPVGNRFALAVMIAIYSYLLFVPVFSPRWEREVNVRAAVSLNTGACGLSLEGSEFLDGIGYRTGDTEGVVSGRSTVRDLPVPEYFDTTWVHIDRSDTLSRNGDVCRHAVTLRMHFQFRPYTVAVRYSGTLNPGRTLRSPWKYSMEKESTAVMSWYSFPDSDLTVPVSWEMGAGDKLVEQIQVTFDRLPCRIGLTRPVTYFIPRTIYSGRWTYSGDASMASGL